MDILCQHRVKFVQTLHSVPSVIDHLFADGVLTKGNKNTVESHQNRDNQVRELLDIITCKGPRVLDPFYKTLVTTDNADLAGLLKADTSGGPSTMKARGGETTPSPLPPKPEQKQYKVLVLEGNEEIKEFVENEHFEPDNCIRIVDKIKHAANNPNLENLVIFILGYFDGNAVEVMSSSNIPISTICSTLVEVMPGKKKICILLHPEDTELSHCNDVEPDIMCQLVALSRDRIIELLKKFERPDNFLSSITNFINYNEIIWPLTGDILLLDGSEENKEVGDFLLKQHSKMNFKYNSETCTRIEEKLSSLQSFQNSAYLVVFLLGQFNGIEVEDVYSSGDGVHISIICKTMKEILPEISKICILLQADNVTPKPVELDKENDNKVQIVTLTNERLTDLIKKLNDTTHIPSCIENFVLPDEKIW